MQRNYKSTSKESAFIPIGLSDEPLSAEVSLFNAMEIREIPFAPQYLVSTEGKIFSKNFNREGYEGELKQHSDWRGYKRVPLTINHKTRIFLVHRLVAIVFIPNPYNLPMINHKNSTTWDNHVENLEWCDSRYNTLYGHKFNSENIHMSKGENHFSHKLTELEVLEIRSLYKKGGQSHKKLAARYGITYQSIADILHRRTWKHI